MSESASYQVVYLQASCLRKRAYPNATKANKALYEMNRRHPDDPHDLQVYRCEHCGQYHIGHDYHGLWRAR